MSENRAPPDGNHCFVCGPDNPVGLRLRFQMDGAVCRAEFTPGKHHVGFDEMTHGGILYCALDDVMANWLFLQGGRGYTARCEMRYREPLASGTRVRLEGRLVRRKGRFAVLEGKALRAADGKTIAECQATFMVIDPGEVEDRQAEPLCRVPDYAE